VKRGGERPGGECPVTGAMKCGVAWAMPRCHEHGALGDCPIVKLEVFIRYSRIVQTYTTRCGGRYIRTCLFEIPCGMFLAIIGKIG